MPEAVEVAKDTNYPLIDKLEALEANYSSLLDEYTTLYGNFINDKALGNTTNTARDSARLQELINAMSDELNKMNSILTSAYGQGLNNQGLSAQASNALHTQSALVNERMKQYNEARNTLAHLVGEEAELRRSAVSNQYTYFVTFFFAVTLILSIGYLFIGGSLPDVLLIIFLLFALFVGWQYYKNVISKVSINTNNSGFDLGLDGMKIKGNFHLMT